MPDRLLSLYAGGLIVAALVLGGGTAKGNWPAFVVQLMVLPLAFAIPRPRLPVGRWPALLLAAMLLTFAAQLLPLGLVTRDLGGIGVAAGGAISLDLGRTLDSLAFVLACAVVFLFVASRSEFEQSRLVGFFFIGVLLNLTVALVQFAAARGVTVGLFLPYQLGAGFFANQNHFSSLLYMAIPLVVWQCVAMRRPWLALPVVGFIVFVQFAAGSLAGIFVSIGATLVGFALLTRIGLLGKAVLLATALAGAVMLSFNPGNILEVDVESPIDRPMIILRTLQGALLNLPWGTGFGTFPLAYPPLEQVADIFSSVVNHAHNDFAELLLEGGIPAGLLLVLYLALLAVRLPALAGSSFRTALFLSITFVLIHSLVDYPLRTIGLGVVFAAFNGILFARREPAPARAAAAARAALPALRKAG